MRAPLMQTVHRATWRVPQLEPGTIFRQFHDQTTVLQRLNLAFLSTFLFIMFSRVFDVKFSTLHIPGITFRFLALFLILTGAFVAAFRDSIGKCVLGFTSFLILAIPFSVWRGGSVQVLMNWLIGLVVFMATAALIPDFRRYVRTARTMAFAILVLTVICTTLGSMENGRLTLESGRFANPNEMAQALLLGMPFMWAIYSTSRPLVSKALVVGALCLMLYVISKTGSREALISIAVIGTFMFLRTSALGKMKLVMTAGIVLLIAVLILPEGLKARYRTFFSTEVEDNASDEPVDRAMLDMAVASANSRKEMLKRSLILTAKHPLLGVGPGMFAVAENEMARAEGKRRGAWLGTHNSFTEVSSECGIPAFLFYSAVVGLSFKKSYRLYRRTRHSPEFSEISTHALALNYSLMAFIVTGMFVHAAYTALLPVLAGMTVSLVRTAEPEIAGRQPDYERA
ncbi:MAG: hypothetical protein C5B51_27505 [Terriglobia bacterium]|nr:MAG: hypothetical protein C5B51_27505 [Terriglobia bacterium]